MKSPLFRQTIRTVVGLMLEKASENDTFFAAPLSYALYLLDINKRDEAGRHEPLEAKDNQAMLHSLRSIRWDRFPYSAIVLLGSGPARAGWNLSAASKLRAELAARRFREKKAPLILTTGGYVHPNQTAYAEALEMKKVLIQEFGIPAEVILVDPHARHTTTNMRNAARVMYRYGIPFEKRALVTTDAAPSAIIESSRFAQRCERELGYQPQKVLGRISSFDLEFVPCLESLQIDPRDPLDP